MARLGGTYQPLSDEENGNDNLSYEHMTELDSATVTWDHIHNLDEFFQRIYYYHQHGGFVNIVLENVYSVIKLLVTFILVTVTFQCVQYDALFGQKSIQHWSDIVDISLFFSLNFLNLLTWIIFCPAFVFFAVPLLFRIRGYWLIRRFLYEVLKITDTDMEDFTWNEVEGRLLSLQKVMRLCVHKAQLDSLDIHNRLLRHENYLIGMLNKGVLPIRATVPILGEIIFLSKGYLYNLQWLLYRIPQAPFLHPWQLRPAYKVTHQRLELENELACGITLLAVGNLIFMPLIFVLQLIFFILENAERAKSQPLHFFTRCWNTYAKLQLRHFNELKHELLARLHLAHPAAEKYVNCFVDQKAGTIARIFGFLCGALLIYLTILILIRESILHIIGCGALLTGCGVVARAAYGLIPDPGVVWKPESLLQDTVKYIHYMPDGWCGTAHTRNTRRQFQELFVFRIHLVIEELFSPLITPLWLFFVLRPKALEIVDFLRNFTVESEGVGDICSFATFNIIRHGNPQWVKDASLEQEMESNYRGKVEGGKLEMSLMNFHVCNREWKPPVEGGCLRYLQSVRQEVLSDFDNNRLSPPQAYQTSLLLQSRMMQSHAPIERVQTPSFSAGNTTTPVVRLRGDVRSLVGASRLSISPMDPGKGMEGGSFMEQPAPSFSYQGALSDSIMGQSMAPPGNSFLQGTSNYPSFSSNSQLFSPNQMSFTLDNGRLEMGGGNDFVHSNLCSSVMYVQEIHQRKRRLNEYSRNMTYQSVAQSMGMSGGRALDPIIDADEQQGEENTTLTSSRTAVNNPTLNEQTSSAIQFRDHVV